MRSPVFVTVFATPHSKNPVKSSVPSYLNVNHTFLERTISKEFTTPQDSVLGVFLKMSYY